MSTNRLVAPAAIAACALALLAPPAHSVTYCTAFNDFFLTQILTDTDSCASYPCNFYAQNFADAREECGDEVFSVPGPAGTPATCEFCYWSECLSVYQNEFMIVPVDEVLPLEKSAAFRYRVLTAPSAQVIFRGDEDGLPPDTSDGPQTVTMVPMVTGRDYLFVLVQGRTRAAAIADPDIPVFFSIAGANLDDFDHIISLVSAVNNDAVAFGWEDIELGDPANDNDLNDVVYTTRCALEIRPSGLPRGPASPQTPTPPTSPQVPTPPGSQP